MQHGKVSGAMHNMLCSNRRTAPAQATPDALSCAETGEGGLPTLNESCDSRSAAAAAECCPGEGGVVAGAAPAASRSTGGGPPKGPPAAGRLPDRRQGVLTLLAGEKVL